MHGLYFSNEASGNIVTFVDEKLEQEIRYSLEKPTGDILNSNLFENENAIISNFFLFETKKLSL